MFDRPHHQKIGLVLYALDGALLRESNCYFGGGTAIALRFGEFRESVDIDLITSDLPSYRELRQLLTGPQGIAPLARAGGQGLKQLRDVRADQYGIRTAVELAGQSIKLEIVLEARIGFETPGASDEICGLATLTSLDLAASKLLANSDRWNDDGVFNRDIIDLAMMSLPLRPLRRAIAKAETAYGDAILRDLSRAIERFRDRPGWLERCMKAMAISTSSAALWQRIRALRRVVP